MKTFLTASATPDPEPTNTVRSEEKKKLYEKIRSGPKKKDGQSANHAQVGGGIVADLRRWIESVWTGVPIVVQQLTSPTSIHEDTGLIPGLAQWLKDPALP